MSNQDDEKALQLLEKAVYKAQDSLEKTQHFQPFMMLLTDTGKIEEYQNEINDSTQSYEGLEKQLQERIKKNDIDVVVLVVDTIIPDKFVDDITSGIRVHLEEKSQRKIKVGARYLYVPYELCKHKEGDVFVNLYVPIPVGFPAEYIV